MPIANVCLTFAIVVQCKVDTSVAEVALSVKENDGTMVPFKSLGSHLLPIPVDTQIGGIGSIAADHCGS
jgi:hypothetical protein